jgi:type I restriction-modification system DNA methylase subunit
MKTKIEELIVFFENNKNNILSNWNETTTRIELINPFFECLGWDVNNNQQLADPFKEVKHEANLKIGSNMKAPDYSFNYGKRLFYLEAKKPAVNIKTDISPAYQLRRYGWTAKLPISILTDFEELAIYDCRIKPDHTDPAGIARIKYYTYKDYIDKWDEIYGFISKEAVLHGSLNDFENKQIKGTASIDDDFLNSIENWRKVLALNIALRNPDLSEGELNFAIQMIIDRIIFLRICEDRGMETYGLLKDAADNNAYEQLLNLFRRADEKYNSGLFHFTKEKERDENPDTVTPRLKIDDKALKDIIRDLYYPECPYELSVISGDVLGSVYERFLGKVIRLTDGHHAKVEEKPEVRKAGGVYYTPHYIVEYIVKNTVGEILKDKTPAQISGIKILDPACGSGSFLIEAYQYLLDRHLDYYINNDPDKWKKGKEPKLFDSPTGVHLTLSERKRILVNNIFGVDIDKNAVEVTKLSLLLKVLEYEGREVQQKSLFNERILPDLYYNIKCGNSLIGGDFYSDKDVSLFGNDEMDKINTFDWGTAFPDVFATDGPRTVSGAELSTAPGDTHGGVSPDCAKDGNSNRGFDVVIGNPPYGSWFKKQEEDYLMKKYSIFSFIKDIYVAFFQCSFTLLKNDGCCSFIIPSSWTGGPKYRALRDFVLKYQINKLVLLPYDVFQDAYIDTLIINSTNRESNENEILTYEYPKKAQIQKIEITQYNSIKQSLWLNSQDKKFIFSIKSINLIKSISEKSNQKIGDVVLMKRGVLFDKKLLSEKPPTEQYYKYFEGDVYRYMILIKTPMWVEFGEKMKEKPKEIIWFTNKRILLRRLVNRKQRLMAVLADESFITNKNLYSILQKEDSNLELEIILSVLNSRLLSFLYLQQVTQATKDDFPQVTIKDILDLPFPNIKKISGSKVLLVSLVEQMLATQKQLHEATSDNDKKIFRQKTEIIDKQIDALVYELYGLNEEEIRIVEGGR